MTSTDRWLLHGEAYLSFEVVADCYGVRVEWLLEAHQLHLLGPVEKVGQRNALAATMMDRVAQLRRITLQTGLDLTTISLLFEFPEGP